MFKITNQKKKVNKVGREKVINWRGERERERERERVLQLKWFEDLPCDSQESKLLPLPKTKKTLISSKFLLVLTEVQSYLKKYIKTGRKRERERERERERDF